MLEICQAERPPLAMTVGERSGGAAGNAYWRTSSSRPLSDGEERLRTAVATGRRSAAIEDLWAAARWPPAELRDLSL